MKLKIILCLALVFNVIMLGCSNPARQPAPVVVSRQTDSPEFVYLIGMFKNHGHITWTNGMTLKDALTICPLDVFARSMIILRHADGLEVRYKWTADKPLTNNPVLKPGDKVISPLICY